MNAVGVKLGNGWYSKEQQSSGDYGQQKSFLSMRNLFCF